MNKCLELLADIVAVIPVPIGTFKFAVPPQVLQHRIMADAVTLPLSVIVPGGSSTGEALLAAIRQQPGFVVDTYIYNTTDDGEPLPKETVIVEFGTTAKETSKQSIAGVSYNTKVSMRTYDDIDKIRALVDNIQESTAFDLFIIDENENVYCCRGMEPATNISMQASLPVNTTSQIDIEVSSMSGILPVIM